MKRETALAAVREMEVIIMMIDLAFLRQRRREKDLRLIDMAKYLGLKTANAYWRIERGMTDLSAVRLMKLCTLLDIKPEKFVVE